MSRWGCNYVQPDMIRYSFRKFHRRIGELDEVRHQSERQRESGGVQRVAIFCTVEVCRIDLATYVWVRVPLEVVTWDHCSLVILHRSVDCIATPSRWPRSRDWIFLSMMWGYRSNIDLTGLECISTSSSCGGLKGELLWVRRGHERRPKSGTAKLLWAARIPGVALWRSTTRPAVSTPPTTYRHLPIP